MSKVVIEDKNTVLLDIEYYKWFVDNVSYTNVSYTGDGVNG